MGCSSSFTIEGACLRNVPKCGSKHKLSLDSILRFVCNWCGEKYELEQLLDVKEINKNCYTCEFCNVEVCKHCYKTALFKLQFESKQTTILKCLENHRLLIRKLNDKKISKGKPETFACNGCIKWDLRGYSLECVHCEYNICMKCVKRKEDKNEVIQKEKELILKSFEEYKNTYKIAENKKKGKRRNKEDVCENEDDEDNIKNQVKNENIEEGKIK